MSQILINEIQGKVTELDLKAQGHRSRADSLEQERLLELQYAGEADDLREAYEGVLDSLTQD